MGLELGGCGSRRGRGGRSGNPPGAKRVGGSFRYPSVAGSNRRNAGGGWLRRRFRPNLVIGGVPGLGERQWEGARLRIGAVVIGMKDLRSRCIMTTFDPDSGQQDLGVLRRVQREFDGRLGLDSYVVAPGRISAGDAVELIRTS